jgi:hypothetical protein
VGKTTDWRAVCGRSACTVRREGRSKPIDLPYPYPTSEEDPVEGVLNLVRELADYPDDTLDSHTLPLALPMRFVVAFLRCVPGLPQESQWALQNWLATVAGWLTQSSAEKQKLLKRLRSSQLVDLRPSDERYVVVRFRRSSNENAYTFAAWLMAEDGSRCDPLLSDSREQTAESIEGALSLTRGEVERTIFDDIRRAVANRGLVWDKRVRLEFILPVHLFRAALDQCRVLDSLGRKRSDILGAVHPVVVRALERYEPSGRAAYNLLRERWEEGWSARGPACILRLRRSPHHDNPPDTPALLDAVGITLENLVKLLDKERILVCVLEDPIRADDLEQQNVLWALLEAGVAVALWCREQPPGGGPALDVLTPLMGGQFVPDLPQRVRVQRAAARDDTTGEWHAGSHLTLFWDDPRRVPPLAFLEMPS